ncbi:histone deacetylase 11 isoform X2 [Tupaia chinensis]|uniref:histone deacetylase 11 isoform X2 n=1 Tax=Tupaia chinensis TaxID=246437 RepID=UPI000FFB851C|nr:histone deacetylase 11 isoform X2 [Tupaia chinensis]
MQAKAQRVRTLAQGHPARAFPPPRKQATRNPAVPACARDSLANRVLSALQHHLHGPGEAAPLRRREMGQSDQFPESTLVEAREASEEDLLVVHTRRYLNELKWSFAVATITEIPPVIFLPNFLVQRKVLRPLRTQTGGTIMAGKLAVERGWAINVGGGFHHCSSDRGGGFCAYADITLAIKFLFERVEGISRATIIDLDAHQGNGHERDFMGDKRVYIMDVYNRHIYPGDRFAKQAIRRKVELEWGVEDDEYLDKVERNMEKALQEHPPDVVVYNAGTDVLEGDRLGGLSISPGACPLEEEGFQITECQRRWPPGQTPSLTMRWSHPSPPGPRWPWVLLGVPQSCPSPLLACAISGLPWAVCHC